MTSLSTGESLVDQAIRAVRNHIRDRDLKVGDTLPGEGTFAAELGVSRAVMREAFGALARLRLLDVGNGRRARVGAIDGSVMATSIDHAVATAQISTTQVWDVRRTIEIRTSELAAMNRSDADAREIMAHASDMALYDGDLDRLTRADIAFHQAIARASGNSLFTQIIRSFEPLMRKAVPSAWHTRTTLQQRAEILALHRDIGQAIADRDAVRAPELMDRHFDKSISDLLQTDEIVAAE